MPAPLVSVIVLTKDEEANLPQLIESLRGLDHQLFVLDSDGIRHPNRNESAANKRSKTYSLIEGARCQ